MGLGVELKSLHGGLMIVRVITGSPAEQAGVRAADQIIAIDGRVIQDLPTDQAANLLQGQEGTAVTLTLLTPGQAPVSVRCAASAWKCPAWTRCRSSIGRGAWAIRS